MRKIIAHCVFMLVFIFAANAVFAVEVDYHGGWSVISGGTATDTESHLGTGAWQGNPATPYFEWYFYTDSLTWPNQTFKVSDIESVTYWTKDGALAPYASGVDFFLALYTKPDGVADDASWYGNRINAEPLYANNYSHGAGWNQWSTGTGTNELTWADHNHGPTGGYNGATWSDIVSTDINWFSIFGGGADNTPINYRDQDIFLIKIGTGSAWNNIFDGYVDEIVITLTPAAGGGQITLDLEGAAVHNVTQTTDHLTIQSAVDAANPGDHIVCDSGTFPEDVLVNKAVQLTGAGIDQSIIRGVIGGASYTVRMAAVGSILEDFTITRDGNNPAQWELALNSTGVAIQGTGGATVRNNKFVGNRSGIDINDADDNQILNNVIDFNRTGMILRNSCLNNLVEENAITNNWTVGVLWLNVGNPNNYATDCKFFNNNISGNWYTQVENRDVISGDVRDFSGNWLGTMTPTTAASDGSEPGYSSIIPVEYGGTSTPPGGAVTLRGVGLASIDYTPWLNAGTDANVETSLGRGTIGFQGNYSNLWVDDLAIQPLGVVQEAVDMVSGSTINLLAGTYVGQVHATGFSNLNIIGAGVGVSIIQAPNTAMPDFFTTSNTNYPILFIENSTAHVSNLTVDGDGKGALSYRFVGVGYYNSGGSITDVSIERVRHDPFNGVQGGNGLLAYNTLALDTLELTNVSVTDFQKNAYTFAGNLFVDADGATTVGAGPTATIAQNGIQLSGGASGSFANCSVTGFEYTPYSVTSTGFLIFGPTTVDISNTDVMDCQTAVYGLDADLSFDGGSISYVANVTSPWGILDWKTAALASTRRVTADAVETPWVGNSSRPRSLDTPNTFSVTNSTIAGDGQTNSLGIGAFSDAGDLAVTATNNVVTGWDFGIEFVADGGTISSGTVTGSTFSNANNTYDNTSGHTWDSNCYSDYPANPGFPGTYEVGDDEIGAPILNVDNNPNPNGCSDVNLVINDGHIGCNSGCTVDTLYVTLDAAGIPNLQVVIDLPAGFAAALPVNGIVTPASNDDPNLIQAFATDLGTQVQVDMGFQSPYSTGNNTLYVACIPVVNVSATSGTYTFTGNNSLWIDNLGGNHVNELLLGSIDIEVDCTVPVISDFVTTQNCAFGDDSQVIDKFSATFTDLDSDLDTAWVSFSGGGSLGLFGPSLTSPQSLMFPSAGDAAAFYALLDEGCNTLTLHLLDSECNEAVTVDLLNVGRDNTDPAPVVTYNQSACYNNTFGDPQYGATLLVGDLDIDLAAATGCEAGTFDLSLTILAENVAAYTAVASITDYPSAGEAATLWNAIVLAVGANYSGSVTVNWTATDCAGNTANGNFLIPCVDFDTPDNAFTYFDARPTHLGVWLDWSWTASTEAQEMAIYRSPLSGEYPAYPSDLWVNTGTNYNVTSYPPPVGWTLVATETQLVAGSYTSFGYSTTNNRDALATHHGSYWLDAETGWVDGDGNANTYRDIYRYVTFVKDQAGNWSINEPVVILQNADRSTNYWLGDFATADGAADPGSRGRVDTWDLSALSVVYFSTSPGDYRNIGPVVVENGNIGKGIPNPDGGGLVNFSDLVPFSFNYGMVSPVGTFATEFVIEPDQSVYRPVSHLDGTPGVSLVVPEIASFEVGTEFTVTVTLSGNDAGVVKAVQALLNYDESQLEIVSSSIGTAASSEGTVFAKVNGTSEAGQIGLVAASCGGYSTLADNATLGTVTFRVKTELTSTCDLELTDVQMFDNTGEIIEIDGETYPLFSAPSVPDNYALYQNYPNPFNPTTNIQFDLKEAGHVEIMVYNTLGQMVAQVANGDLTAGRHTVSFDASTLASGVYIYTINVNGFSDLKKMVLIK